MSQDNIKDEFVDPKAVQAASEVLQTAENFEPNDCPANGNELAWGLSATDVIDMATDDPVRVRNFVMQQHARGIGQYTHYMLGFVPLRIISQGKPNAKGVSEHEYDVPDIITQNEMDFLAAVSNKLRRAGYPQPPQATPIMVVDTQGALEFASRSIADAPLHDMMHEAMRIMYFQALYREEAAENEQRELFSEQTAPDIVH